MQAELAAMQAVAAETASDERESGT